MLLYCGGDHQQKNSKLNHSIETYEEEKGCNLF
jgi:hypothetical protein